jgi:hypothetical protein
VVDRRLVRLVLAIDARHLLCGELNSSNLVIKRSNHSK